MSNLSAWSNLRPPPDGKYVVLPSGELQIRNVSAEDGFKTYKCRTKHRWQSYWKNQRQRQRFVCTLCIAQGKQSKNMDDFGISGWPGRRNCQQQQGGWSSQVGRESKTQERDRSPKTSTGLNPPGRHIFGSFRRSAPLCFHISSGCHSTGLIWDCCFLWE